MLLLVNKTSKLDTNYVSGFVDGEGCFELKIG
jgi:hypothetical protein